MFCELGKQRSAPGVPKHGRRKPAAKAFVRSESRTAIVHDLTPAPSSTRAPCITPQLAPALRALTCRPFYT
eukprot:1537747-Heterocapsa_arctica.AAC.1